MVGATGEGLGCCEMVASVVGEDGSCNSATAFICVYIYIYFYFWKRKVCFGFSLDFSLKFHWRNYIPHNLPSHLICGNIIFGYNL